MRRFQCLLTAVCLSALGLHHVALGQEEQVILVPADATYDYLFTIKEVGGAPVAIDPTADPSFAFVDPNSPETNVAIWPFPEYDPVGVNNTVNGVIRDTGAAETLQWRRAPGPFIYDVVAGVTGTPTDLLQDALGGAYVSGDLQGQKLTQYFRTNFTTTTPLTDISLDVLIDDSAVFYIDGFEVARYNCCWSPDGAGPETPPSQGGGAPFFDSVADDNNDVGNEDTRNVAWNAPWVAGSPNVVDLSFLGGTLTPGDHVFSASVHSYGGFTSSDLGYDVILSATVVPEPSSIGLLAISLLGLLVRRHGS